MLSIGLENETESISCQHFISDLIIFVTLAQAVTLHTDVGDIKIELFCERTPKTCEVSQITGMRLSSVEAKHQKW